MIELFAIAGDALGILLPQRWSSLVLTLLFNRLQFDGIHCHRIRRHQQNAALIDEILNLGQRATVPYLSHAIHDVQHRLRP